MTVNNGQFDSKHQFQHLLSIQGLETEFISKILDIAQAYLQQTQGAQPLIPSLKQATVVNLFYEASTRTRVSFELAAKRLGGDVVNIYPKSSSSQKNESLQDTIATLQAMDCRYFVLRHPQEGVVSQLAAAFTDVHLINAGDGMHAHPSQALVDLLTIRQQFANFKPLKVAIIGDIAHSRVARSLIPALTLFQVSKIHLIGPPAFVPETLQADNINIFHHLSAGLEGVDVVVLLRIQKERMIGAQVPNDYDYHQNFGLTLAEAKKLHSDALILHPGPMNRGIEIESGVAQLPQAKMLQQVKNGVAIRQAILTQLGKRV